MRGCSERLETAARVESSSIDTLIRDVRAQGATVVIGERLVQNTTTPGNGDEPGFAFTIASNGTISQ